MKASLGRKLVLAALLGAAVPVGLAVAHEGGGARHEAMKEKFDANKDGKLDDSERAAMHQKFEAKREARHAEMLATYDADKNGTLDEAERKSMREARAAERFAELDTNKDGALSLAEFQAGSPFGHGFHGRRGHPR
jgi:Ca2+-binding EF-hand superfamily protein